MPGGCDFGVRPIDQHLKGFAALGASYKLDGGMVDVRAEQLKGSHIYLDVVSVGATVNIILAAVRAKGMTVIENAAKEPHIVDLANFLNSMGADIRGAGTDVIKIYGVEHLNGTTYSIIPDQIEAGTYMVAAAATSGDVLIKNVIPKHLESITAKLEEMGVEVTEYDDSIRVRRKARSINAILRPCHTQASLPICSHKSRFCSQLPMGPASSTKAFGITASVILKNSSGWARKFPLMDVWQ